MDNLLDAENEFKEKILYDEIAKLKNENTKLKILLKEAGIETGAEQISDEEAICVREINKLNTISEMIDDDGNPMMLTSDDVKKLDLLVKNLKLIRGENTRVGRKSKMDKMSSKDLMKELAD